MSIEMRSLSSVNHTVAPTVSSSKSAKQTVWCQHYNARETANNVHERQLSMHDGALAIRSQPAGISR